MTTSKHKSKAYRDGYQAYLATNGRSERVDTQYRNSNVLEAEFWCGWQARENDIFVWRYNHRMKFEGKMETKKIYICNVCGKEHDYRIDAIYCHPDIVEKEVEIKKENK